MSDIPFVDTENAQNAKNQAKNLIPWLEDPHMCECGAYCDSDVQYVERQAMAVKVWVCPNEECGKRYYRNRE